MNRIRWCLAAFAAVVSMSFASQASAQVRYVDPDGSNGANGLSWANAWETLEYALNELNANGGFTTIWISHGGSGYEYTPGTSASDTYLVQRPVSIYGGFQGPSGSYPSGETALGQRVANARTTLSGDLGSSVHCDHIMVVADAEALSRVSVTLHCHLAAMPFSGFALRTSIHGDVACATSIGASMVKCGGLDTANLSMATTSIVRVA